MNKIKSKDCKVEVVETDVMIDLVKFREAELEYDVNYDPDAFNNIEIEDVYE